MLTEDDLRYSHNLIFYDYEKIKKFALSVKKKGIINLEYWVCEGLYEWDGYDAHLKEFEEEQLICCKYLIHNTSIMVSKYLFFQLGWHFSMSTPEKCLLSIYCSSVFLLLDFPNVIAGLFSFHFQKCNNFEIILHYNENGGSTEWIGIL